MRKTIILTLPILLGLLLAIGIEHKNILKQEAQLQSAADHGALAAQKYAKMPSLVGYRKAAQKHLYKEFNGMDLTLEDELSDDFEYTIHLSSPVKFKYASFGIFPKRIQKSATVGSGRPFNKLVEIEALLPKSGFGTRTIMNIHAFSNENRFRISEDQESLTLPDILKRAEQTYFEEFTNIDESSWDVIVIATDKPIDPTSCKMIENRSAPMIIHPYGANAKETQLSCPQNMIYCCGHKIIRWNFSTSPSKLPSNLFEILTGLEHIHVTC